MKWTDIIRLCLLNLWRRKFRCALTVVGVVVGCACIILMVSFSVSGFENYKSSLFEGASFTEINVYPTQTGGLGTQGKALNDNAVSAFRSISNVKGVSPIWQIPCSVKIGRKTQVLQISAVDFSVMHPEYSITPDRLQILLGEDAVYMYSDSLGYDRDKIEEESKQAFDAAADTLMEEKTTLSLGYSAEYMEAQGQMAGEYAQSVIYTAQIAGIVDDSTMGYMDLSAAKKLIRENRKLADQQNLSDTEYHSVKIYADNTQNVKQIISDIETLGYTAYSPVQDLDNISSEFIRQQVQYLVMACIALFVSAIGIANTMLSGVLERKTEIGILKVIGMAQSKIRLMFLIESALLGLVGGLIGTAISYVVVMFVNNGAASLLTEQLAIGATATTFIPIWLPLATNGISVVIGVLSGIYPAFKATTLSPMEAIRNE